MTFLDKQPPVKGTVVAHCYRMEQDACDVALVSLQPHTAMSLSNKVCNSSGRQHWLEIFSGDAEDIWSNDCFKFEAGFDRSPGRVIDLAFGYNYKAEMRKISNCIAVVHRDDPTKSFVEEGDCGKIVGITSDTCVRGFGILFGEVTHEGRGENGTFVHTYALLTHLTKTLHALKQHKACRGSLQLISG